MKICIVCSLVFLFGVFSSPLQAQEITLADPYRSGQIRLERVLLIDDDSLPKNTYFQYPTGIARVPDGRLFVVDYNAHHIKTFDASGKFLGVIGRQGQGPGEFNFK